MVKCFSHVAFVVKDMGKSLNFYCDILGFKKLFDFKEEDGSIRISYIKIGDGQFLELFNGRKAKMTSEQDFNLSHLLDYLGYSHLCLEVDDIFKIAEILRLNNLLIVEPKVGRDLNYQCWGIDPDGNKIEFMKMEPDSPQMENR